MAHIELAHRMAKRPRAGRLREIRCEVMASAHAAAEIVRDPNDVFNLDTHNASSELANWVDLLYPVPDRDPEENDYGRDNAVHGSVVRNRSVPIFGSVQL